MHLFSTDFPSVLFALIFDSQQRLPRHGHHKTTVLWHDQIILQNQWISSLVFSQFRLNLGLLLILPGITLTPDIPHTTLDQDVCLNSSYRTAWQQALREKKKVLLCKSPVNTGLPHKSQFILFVCWQQFVRNLSPVPTGSHPINSFISPSQTAFHWLPHVSQGGFHAHPVR